MQLPPRRHHKKNNEWWLSGCGLVLVWLLSTSISGVKGNEDHVSVARVFLGSRQLVPIVVVLHHPPQDNNNNTTPWLETSTPKLDDIWKETWGFELENNSLVGTIQQTLGNGSRKLFRTKLELSSPTSVQLYWAELQFTKSGKETITRWQKRMELIQLQRGQDGCIVSKGKWTDNTSGGYERDCFFSSEDNGRWLIRVQAANYTVFWYGTLMQQEAKKKVNKMLAPMIVIIAIVITRMFRIYLIPKAKKYN
jgi:hypothetical protein